jgi:hypothetical protein
MCDGQPSYLAHEIAQALGDLLGPKRREARSVNQFGGKGVIKFAPSNDEVTNGVRESITLVDWQSQDGLPHPVTCEIGRIVAGGGGSFPQGVDPAGTALIYRAQAQVIFGSPAAMQDPFFMDIGRGQRFTVAASYVAITAQMLAPSPGDASGSMVAVAGLGFGTSPTLAPILFTQYLDAIKIAGTKTIIVPPRANVLLPLVSNHLVTNVTVEFLNNNGGTIQVYAAITAPIVLPEETYAIRVTNNGAFASFSMIFQLSV